MSIPAKIKNLLDKNAIKYDVFEHKTVYTAYDKAATLRVPEKMVGKTLVVKLDKEIALVLISANRNLDKKKFLTVANKWLNSHGRIRIAEARRAKARYSYADFATERLIKSKLKGVKIGAVPPFGVLWKMPTFVDRALMNQQKIIVNGGAHEVSLRITPAAYKKLAPDIIVGSFGKAR